MTELELVQAVWANLITTVETTDRQLRELGYGREADQVGVFVEAFTRTRDRHVARLGKAPTVPREAMAEAVVDGLVGVVTGPESDVVEVTVPTLEEYTASMLAVVRAERLRVTHNARRMQELDVAESFLSRALDLARRGHDKAEQQLRAAENVLSGGGEL